MSIASPGAGLRRIAAPPLGRPAQIAYAVRDIEQAVETWVRVHGAGPFLVLRHIPVHDVVYRGRPATFDHSSAYGQLGDVMIELVLDHTDGPSPVNGLLGADGEGLHHMAYLVDDTARTRAALAAMGWPEVFRASTGGGQFYFHESGPARTGGRPATGHLIELYEPDEGVRAFYRTVADAARDWDGREPLRELGR